MTPTEVLKTASVSAVIATTGRNVTWEYGVGQSPASVFSMSRNAARTGTLTSAAGSCGRRVSSQRISMRPLERSTPISSASF
jgi:hypothetical protein